MSTLVCFHAHPDDEAIQTGGLMAKASAAGHRVVLVCATRGEQGEPQEGVLNDDEQLWQRRMDELDTSCQILGADEPRWLGYEDSGMEGEPTNDNPACFWQADVDDATERLAAILREVDAGTLTIYDNHGGYGHPDHIQVHRVGWAAAKACGLDNVFEATINRDGIEALMEASAAAAEARGEEPEGPGVDRSTFGTPSADIAYQVDVSSHVDKKKDAMMAHRSQIGPDGFFLQMPDDFFTMAFGAEWFNVPGITGTGGPTEVELLPGLD
ncbi:MAG: LmbE family N-acetylglucosaminyl deacetylase [Acidimicrobiales bacterium]|jgi:LmbE family N-acetylglucosaminyl deacetylase